MSTFPDPDEHGRYRVRRKGNTQSPAWSTTRFDPESHVSVSGPASDTYGNPWPVKPHRRFESQYIPEVTQDADPDITTNANPDEESQS